jgi:alkylhydroperoxidase family enzyme
LSRIPLVEPSALTPVQAEAYKNSPAGKLDLFRLLAHAQTIYPGFSQMTHAIFAQLTIPPNERELMVLAVLHLDRGAYEWAQHVQIAQGMGIPQVQIDAIAQGCFAASAFDERQRALLSFTRQVVKTIRIDEPVFAAVAAIYTPRQIVESIFAIGIYMTILRVSEAAELEIDAVMGATVLSDAVAKELAG